MATVSYQPQTKTKPASLRLVGTAQTGLLDGTTSYLVFSVAMSAHVAGFNTKWRRAPTSSSLALSALKNTSNLATTQLFAKNCLHLHQALASTILYPSTLV